jgi:membrane protein DedA with SNARE-associated domain
MPAARALVPAALASAIWYAFLVTAGSVLAQSWPRAQALLADANRALAIVMASGAALVVLWWWRARRRT